MKAPPWHEMASDVGSMFLVAIKRIYAPTNMPYWTFIVVTLKDAGVLGIFGGWSCNLSWCDVEWYIPIKNFSQLPFKNDSIDNKLEWLEGSDDQDNVTWMARSCIYDYNNENKLAYQITPVLRNNSIWWSIETSANELLDGIPKREFPSVKDAQQVCEDMERYIIQNELDK